ncbi:cytochrome P450 [Mycena galericulata]|nr:cytochrome P450 [Mycena galericulata]
MEDPGLNIRTLCYSLALIVLSISWFRFGQKSTIPAVVGTRGPISSCWAALQLLHHAADVIQLGYSRYCNGVFRVPTLFRWDYVANGPQRIAEVASAPEDVLSFNHGVEDSLQADYTIGPQMTTNPYHAPVIRGGLTRNLGRCFPQVRDEIVHAFDDVLSLESKEWKLINVLPDTMQIIARTSNRLFVGLPLCKNQEYLDLAVNYTVSVFVRGSIIGLLPGFLKPILAPLISTRKSSLRHALKFLGPIIDERLEKETEYGRDWPGRPNDLVSWLLDVAEGEERTTPALALRVLATNMAAIHTTSMALTSMLFDLTTYPEHILPMREEAERVVAEQGWSKASLANMHKIDSFIRESQRLGTRPVTMVRKVLPKEGFTFSDGMKIPHGAFLSVPSNPVHHDLANYDRPDVFDGFRFSRLREENKGQGDADGGIFNRYMVTTGLNYLAFGHGRHSCPGRFFAATELKAILAHILINYDVKAEVDGVRPPDQFFGMQRMQNSQGKIFIRRRE